VGGPVKKDKLFFFFSEERARSTARPSTLTANTCRPGLADRPHNANYVAPALRDPNAVKLLSAWPAPNRAPADRAVRQGHRCARTIKQDTTPGSGARRLRPQRQVAPHRRATRTTTASETTRAGRPVLRHWLIPNVATTDTNVPGQVAAARCVTIARRMLNEFSVPVLVSNKIASVYGENDAQQALDQFGLTSPRSTRRTQQRLIPLVNVTGLSDRRQPAVRHPVQELHPDRQLHLAARQPLRFKAAA
jgi:hypothetical protein